MVLDPGSMLSDLGLIGNCQIAALVRRDGRIVWSCMPRFDSPPIFASLLDETEGGAFTVEAADGSLGIQRYLPNTNILQTRFEGIDGAFSVTDFAPRYRLHDRHFRPTKLVRVVEPLSGRPRIRVSCDPVLGWTRQRPRRFAGSNHLSWHGYETELRLTTDVPLSYLDGDAFALSGRRHFILAWGEPVEEPLAQLAELFWRETERYWQTWVKHCDIPSLYQEEVIRSALALKLHCFEDTGAIAAALTTSLPEAPGAGRNWDYRYCWLRDAYYTLDAFRLLGHFEEREQFIDFLLNIAASSPGIDLQPLYRIDGKRDLDEFVLDAWPGYLGNRPVRIGNGAATHKQHDVYGEMVLALTPVFFDARHRDQVTPVALDLITALARKAVAVAGTPDAGIWEVRSEWTVQTFSNLMCWAGAERMSRVASRHRPELLPEFVGAAQKIHSDLLARGIDPARNCLVGAFGGKALDAALLQAVTLRFLPSDDPRLHATVDAIVTELGDGGWLRRYRTYDGLGYPEVAFTLCTFWLVQALAGIGRLDEARRVLECVLAIDMPLGLLSEDYDPNTKTMWGNFPQAYSHVGLIHAAFAAAPPWSELL